VRLVERVRTRYRADDLTSLLPLDQVESRALPGETHTLAMTASLVAAVYGGRVTDAMLVNGGYVHSEGDQDWWLPSGRVYYHDNPSASSAVELSAARGRFFQPCRFRDPFGTDAWVEYDSHSLLLLGSKDALENRVSSGER